MTPPLPPRGSGEGGLVGSARGARGWGAETSGPALSPRSPGNPGAGIRKGLEGGGLETAWGVSGLAPPAC